MTRVLRRATARALRHLTRTSAFLRKDILDFIRQPRLVLALVLGPFMILLLFGLGFRSEPIPLRTLIVMSGDNVLRPYVEQNARTLIRQLILVDIVESESFARNQLINDSVDVVIIVPHNVREKIQSNEHPVFVTLHNTIDPTETRYMDAFTDVYINEANRRALATAVREAQGEAAQLKPELEAAQETVATLRRALAQGSEERATEAVLQLRRNLLLIQQGLGSTEWLLLGLDEILAELPFESREKDLSDPLAALQGALTDIAEIESDDLISDNSLERIGELESHLGQLKSGLEEFRRADPSVVVSPFVGKTRTVGRASLTVSDYYVPATISLLLQHLCVTFGALSIARERRIGTIEVFRASPLAAIEVLAGKYLSYWLSGAFVASTLTGLLVLVLKIPMLGSWWEYVVTLAVLMFTSLGLGFVISLAARSISQAVQYAMIALLASVFFSGFFLSLNLLRWSVRLVSWIIPAAYGIRLLQDVMLRGLSFQTRQLMILGGIGAVLFVITWVGLRKIMLST